MHSHSQWTIAHCDEDDTTTFPLRDNDRVDFGSLQVHVLQLARIILILQDHFAR